MLSEDACRLNALSDLSEVKCSDPWAMLAAPRNAAEVSPDSPCFAVNEAAVQSLNGTVISI